MKRIQFSAWCLVIALSCIHLAAADDRFDQSAVPIERDTRDPKLTKVVLLAGEPSSKTGQHEYFAGCALMMNWLQQTPGIWPVIARTWPTNEGVFENARSIVVFMDGGAQHPLVEEARRRKLGALAEEGIGVVVLHQSMDLPKDCADDAKATIGGVWLADIGCRGHWDMTLAPVKGKTPHPILRGVQPFTAKGDGWLYNLHFADAPGFTPLLAGQVPDKSRTTADAKGHTGRSEVIAWAYERENGGRAFCFTGADLHKNWEIESQRRLVVNGILWCAGIEVPTNGARVDFKPQDLARNLDRKAEPATAKPVAKRSP